MRDKLLLASAAIVALSPEMRIACGFCFVMSARWQLQAKAKTLRQEMKNVLCTWANTQRANDRELRYSAS